MAAAVVVAAWVVPASSSAEEDFITIGTGGVTGVYYPTGAAICRLVNKGRTDHGIRCSVEATGGSVYNLNMLRNGELDLGVAQSDWHHHAYHGTSAFSDTTPFRELRSVFSIHPEPVTIVARSGSGITHLHQLKGRRINIGNPGSGSRATWEVLEAELGWTRGDLELAAELRSAETAQALCDGKIDAFFWLVGHPSALTKEAVSTCGARLVEVTGPAIDRLLGKHGYYRHAVIPGGMYDGHPDDVKTFGVGATFVSSAQIPDDVIYQVVKSVFENLDDFRRLHPAFAGLRKEEMVRDALSAPLHAGASRYYREAGLL